MGRGGKVHFPSPGATCKLQEARFHFAKVDGDRGVTGNDFHGVEVEWPWLLATAVSGRRSFELMAVVAAKNKRTKARAAKKAGTGRFWRGSFTGRRRVFRRG